jgi:hypothetical protein
MGPTTPPILATGVNRIDGEYRRRILDDVSD